MFSVPLVTMFPQNCKFVKCWPAAKKGKMILLIRTANPARIKRGMIVAKASRRDLKCTSFPTLAEKSENLSNIFFPFDLFAELSILIHLLLLQFCSIRLDYFLKPVITFFWNSFQIKDFVIRTININNTISFIDVPFRTWDINKPPT